MARSSNVAQAKVICRRPSSEREAYLTNNGNVSSGSALVAKMAMVTQLCAQLSNSQPKAPLIFSHKRAV
jgi:hypothetical protein